jgi:LCP family protein required for cell wall assembly
VSRLDEAQTEQDGPNQSQSGTSPGKTHPGTEPDSPSPASTGPNSTDPDSPSPASTSPGSTEPDSNPDSLSPASAPRRRGRLAIRLLGICVALGLVLAGAGLGVALWLERGYNNNVERIGDPFEPLDEGDRPKAAPDAMNILMLGSDSRISADPGAWIQGAQRTDAIMIAHIPADRSTVTVTSIPRDSWVGIPGHGKNKINAGFSFGGPTLMVETVEKLTGVRLDHVVIVDFEGFKDITDDLDGVRINVSATGPQTMDGETALKYVRQRHNLPGGDFDRVKRQQNWIRAVALKTLDKGTLTKPLKLNAVLNSLTSSIAADDALSVGRMRSLAISLRSVRGDDLTFLTAPVAGTGRSPDGKQSIVNLDATANRALWKAVAADELDTWLAAHPDAALGRSVR